MIKTLTRYLALTSIVTAALTAESSSSLPHLEKRGQATQLIVDGHPWLISGQTFSMYGRSDDAVFDNSPPEMTRLNLNTVLVSMAWAWIEPEEGKFDFALVDGLLEGARKNNQRVIFLWFGSWKNSISSFAPAWVKRDTARFPRARIRGGLPLEILSPFSRDVVAADARAYAKFMEHLAQVDSARRTTLMIQLENEVGVLGDSRDRSDVANTAFAQPVPGSLTDYMSRTQEHLSPPLRQLWQSAGARTSGSWNEVFGPGPLAEELFMAWQYARDLETIAAAGKQAYALPVFTNTWIVQPEDRGPGDYPSGGAKPLTLDVWKAAAPSIDLNCPDIYLPNFPDHVEAFHRWNNPLFVPESRGDAAGVANAFYAIGQHAALGYSPFGIDETTRLLALRPEPDATAPQNLEDTPLARGYAVLRNLTPLILDHQASGTVASVWLSSETPRKEISLGDYTLIFELRRNGGKLSKIAPPGYALAVATAADEYIIAGSDVQVTFVPHGNDGAFASVAEATRGSFHGGEWHADREMSGDDIMLDFHLANSAMNRQSGSGLYFPPNGPVIQRVKVYQYK